MSSRIIIAGVPVAAAMIGLAFTLSHRSDKESTPAAAGSSARLSSQLRQPEATSRGSAPKYLPGIERIVDAGLHWEERVFAVRELPSPLGLASVDRLFGFLAHPGTEDKNHWYVVANEVMEVIRKRGLAPGIYTGRMLELFASREADPTIRDYASQHLCQWISGVDPDAREKDPQRIEAAFEALLAEATNPSNGGLTLVGSTLAGLADMTLASEETSGYREQVESAALKIIGDPAFSSLNRSSALQVAARLDLAELPAMCRTLVADTGNPPDLRLSSIAALGLIGDRADTVLLNHFLDDPVYGYAAKAALARLGE